MLKLKSVSIESNSDNGTSMPPPELIANVTNAFPQFLIATGVFRTSSKILLIDIPDDEMKTGDLCYCVEHLNEAFQMAAENQPQIDCGWFYVRPIKSCCEKKWRAL